MTSPVALLFDGDPDRGVHRPVSDVAGERDRMPARPLGRQVREHSR